MAKANEACPWCGHDVVVADGYAHCSECAACVPVKTPSAAQAKADAAPDDAWGVDEFRFSR